jgi:hypothetical protein
MKLHVAPEFSKNLQTARPASIQRVATLISAVEASRDEKVLEDLSGFSVRALEKGVYAAAAGTARLFFTFGEEGADKYMLLLDVIEYEPVNLGAGLAGRRSPLNDSKLNPNINSKLNPYINSRLNPFVNSRLNPYVNSRLNPYVNSQLNPLVNSRLNPLVNSRLNPLINSKLNPVTNPQINPRTNRSFQGPFIYDLGLKECGFIVPADENVILTFDKNLARTGLGAKNSVDGYTLFDTNSKWVGQLVPDGQGGYLHFDTSSQWVGIAT